MAGTAEANGWNGPGWDRSDWNGPRRGGPGFGGPGGNGPGYGGPGWGGPVHYWHPLAILLIIFGFMVWWPIGLALLVAKVWRTSMGCRYDNHNRWEYKMQRMQRKMDLCRSWFEGGFGDRRYSQSSGNRAFDEYKTETLKRLEEEQQEFKGFLDRLRQAKDKAEFDQFMADRKSRPSSPPDRPQQG